MKLAYLILLTVWIGSATAQPDRIILIRHGEKPDDESNPHLSDTGRQRAEHLFEWLRQSGAWTATPPTVLYAARPTSGGRSLRCLETLQPMAKSLHLEVKTPYLAEDYARLAHDLSSAETLRGQTVLICWVHDNLPAFAKALGVKPAPPKWKKEDFNTFYVITWDKGRAVWVRKQQR
jgi:hypothetical protein